MSAQMIHAVAAEVPVTMSPAEDFRFGVTAYLLAAGRSDAVAVVDKDHSYSYAELRTAVASMRQLYASTGLDAGDRIGILATNSFFWVAAYLAAMTGYVAVPLSDRLTPTEAARQVEFAGCRVIAVEQRHQRTYGAAFDGIAMLTETDLARAPAGDPLEWTEVDADADAALMFTSGTTARPKAVRVTHRNLRANTESIISYLELDATDRMLVVLPFYYCFGASLLHTHLRVGGSVALCNTFAFPETAIDMLDRELCTGFAGVPSTYQLLLRASTFAGRELPALRRLQQAGGKLPPVMIEELLAAKPNARLFVMYGQTEGTARLSYLPPEYLASKLGSVGRGIPGVRLEVLDEVGGPVAPGVIGEIYATGDNISPGYFADAEASQTKFPGGRLRTGDLARVDDEGFIYIVDRRDDFIKSWGHRVSSQEIEAAAMRMSVLVSAAVVGVPDPQSGEAIELFAVQRSSAALSEKEVLAYLRGVLAKHMVPRHVHFVDALPLNPAGKIVKGALRELAATWHNETDGSEGPGG